MITWAIHITKHNGTADVIFFSSRWQAEYYLHLIPFMQIDGNAEALEIYKAKLGSMEWIEHE